MQVNTLPSLIFNLQNSMNKFNFVRDGQRRLPPGFRFQPTEQEIVFQYLARKIFSHPLPASVIPEIDTIFSSNPWDLPGDSEQDRYFFANRELNDVNSRKRKRCVGFWKVSGSDKQIICSKRMPMIGMKKSSVFFKDATKTDWFMHVYCIALPSTSNIHYNQSSFNQIGKWVLCHVFSQKRINKSRVHGTCHHFTIADTSDLDSYDSDSSVLSELSSETATSETTDS